MIIKLMQITSLIMILFSVFGICGLGLMLAMMKGNNNQKERKNMVKYWNNISVIMNIVVGIIIAIYIAFCLIAIYYLTDKFLPFLGEDKVIIKYLFLLFILIIMEPFLILIIKAIKMDLYKKYICNEFLQSLAVDFCNEILRKYHKLPVKLITYILYFFLAIAVNINTLGDIGGKEYLYVYLSLGTYYTFDRIIDCLNKEYPQFLKKYNNKLFNFDKIDSSVKFKISDLTEINKYIFDYYIENGEFPTFEEEEKKNA